MTIQIVYARNAAAQQLRVKPPPLMVVTDFPVRGQTLPHLTAAFVVGCKRTKVGVQSTYSSSRGVLLFYSYLERTEV